MAAAAGAGEPSPYAEAAGSDLLNTRTGYLPPSPSPVVGKPLSSGAVPRHAYVFDGEGRFSDAPWDVAAAPVAPGAFTWYHIELPRQQPGGAAAKPLHHAQALIELLCPPLTLQEILAFVATGPHCGVVDGGGGAGALLLRVSSPGPVGSAFALRLAARVTESSVVTVSVGGVPRLAFGTTQASLLSEVPLGVTASLSDEGHGGGRAVEGGVVIEERLLESLLAMNHADGAHTDNPVPRTVSNLLVHVLGTHVDHVHDIVTRLEMELDSIELHLDKGGHFMRKLLLDGRRFPKMHLDLQRLLQVVSHGDQVFPRVKEKCASKSWFASEDIVALEDLIGRLRRLKENLGFITNRVTTLQASLDSWQSEQINKSLYYLSFLSIIFLPLSIVTGVFGMNVGGVPWTEQKNPANLDGFFNVMLICVVILLILLLCFLFPSLYSHVSAWRTRRALTRSSSHTKRHLKLFKGHKEGYMRL
uniref:Magnesium transporter n=1 Tax=Oryza punctata TaxID=4537 RepID=A0A0E0LQX2_ORYPU